MKLKSFKNFLIERTNSLRSLRSSSSSTKRSNEKLSLDTISLAGNWFRTELNESRRNSRSNSVASTSRIAYLDSPSTSYSPYSKSPSTTISSSSYDHHDRRHDNYGHDSYCSYDSSSNNESISSITSSSTYDPIDHSSTEDNEFNYLKTIRQQMSVSTSNIS